MRGRIARVVALTSATIVLVFVIPLCLLVGTLARDRMMAAADQEARTIALLVSSLAPGAERQALIAAADGRSWASTVVLYPDGTAEGGDGQAFVTDPEVSRARAGLAFEVVDERGGRVLVPVVVDDGTAVVRTSVTPAQLSEGVWPAWLTIAGLGVALIGVALVVALQAGRRLAAPLLAVADTAHALRQGDMSARAGLVGPVETVEVARSLNGLADRLGELLASERAAVGDLAHRLRTPITALRLEVDGVQPPETAERLTAHLLRLQEATDQLVREARRPVASDLDVPCDAVQVVANRAGYWAALADDQGRALRLDIIEGPVMVACPEGDLRDVLDILIDNVFAHTDEGVDFSLRVAVEPGACVLTVADDGQGFPPGRPESRVGSTGLGLEIAERTVARHGGAVERSVPGVGAMVSVRLPLRS